MKRVVVFAALLAAAAVARGAPPDTPAPESGASVLLDRLLDASGADHAALRDLFASLGAPARAEAERRLAEEPMSPRDRAFVIAIRELFLHPAEFERAQKLWDSAIVTAAKGEPSRVSDLAMGLQDAVPPSSHLTPAVWTIETLAGHGGERPGADQRQEPEGHRGMETACRVQSAIAFGRTHDPLAAPGLAAVATDRYIWWVAKMRAGALLFETAPRWLPAWLAYARPDVTSWLAEVSATKQLVALITSLAAQEGADPAVRDELVGWLLERWTRAAISPSAMDEGARAATTVLRRFEAEGDKMFHKSGSAAGDAWEVVPGRDGEADHVVYGPYVRDLPQDSLLFARWRFRLDECKGDAGDGQLVLDITRDKGNHQLGSQTVRTADVVAGQWTTWTMPFRLDTESDVEFRVRWNGDCRASIDCVEVLAPKDIGMNEPWVVERPARSEADRAAAARVFAAGLDKATGPEYRVRRDALLANPATAFGALAAVKAAGPATGVTLTASRLADAEAWKACDEAFAKSWIALPGSCPFHRGNIIEGPRNEQSVWSGQWTYSLPGEKLPDSGGDSMLKRLISELVQGPELPASALWPEFLREQVRLFAPDPSGRRLPGAGEAPMETRRFHALLHLTLLGEESAARELRAVADAKPDSDHDHEDRRRQAGAVLALAARRK